MKKIWKTEKREYRRNKTHKKKPTDLLHDKITVFQKKKKCCALTKQKVKSWVQRAAVHDSKELKLQSIST